jgi:hypothetical protein
LWKSLWASAEIVAWRGLRRDAREISMWMDGHSDVTRMKRIGALRT